MFHLRQKKKKLVVQSVRDYNRMFMGKSKIAKNGADMVSRHEDILKKTEEKKEKFHSYKFQPFKGVFLYPSSSGKMSDIRISAIRHIESMAKIKKIEELSWSDITEINRSIDDNFSGKIRNNNCYIKRVDGELTLLPTGMEIDHFKLCPNFIKWLKNSKYDPIRLAVEAHIRLVLIHPFSDGNGRTANLFMNLILLQGGCQITIIDDCDKYLYLLRKVNESKKYEKDLEIDFDDESLSKFCSFIYQMIYKSLDLYLEKGL